MATQSGLIHRHPSYTRMRSASPCLWLIVVVMALGACARAESGAATHRKPAADTNAHAVSVSRQDSTSSVWSYRLTNGWLTGSEGYEQDHPDTDNHDYVVGTRAECHGQAEVRRCPDGKCFRWRLRGVQCTGKGRPRDADWLHDGIDSAAIAREDTVWSVTSNLPGRGVCFPKVETDGRGEPVRIAIGCDWQCRDPKFACLGGATYEITRRALPARSPLPSADSPPSHDAS